MFVLEFANRAFKDCLLVFVHLRLIQKRAVLFVSYLVVRVVSFAVRVRYDVMQVILVAGRITIVTLVAPSTGAFNPGLSVYLIIVSTTLFDRLSNVRVAADIWCILFPLFF